MRIRILASAQEDLKEGYKFYENQIEGLGNYFLDEIFTDIESLKINVGIHEKHFDHFRALSNRFPFAIYYKAENKEIYVRAVLDCRKKPAWVRERFDS